MYYPVSDQNMQAGALSELAGDLFLFKLKTFSDPNEPRFAYMELEEDDDEEDDEDGDVDMDREHDTRIFEEFEYLGYFSVIKENVTNSRSQLHGFGYHQDLEELGFWNKCYWFKIKHNHKLDVLDQIRCIRFYSKLK
ncbi:unnamed protein product [Aureobasidium pullulans]|nr:unnamed protein product [Aureobasidium pullulans]